MQLRRVLLPVAVDLAAGVAFAVEWGNRWQDCAPPSPVCALPGTVCAAVCVDAWAQWPATFTFGVLLGVAPAAMALAVLLSVGIPVVRPTPIAGAVLSMSIASIVLMAVGLDLIFLAWLSPGGGSISLGIIAAAVALFILGALPRRPTAVPGSR